MAEIERAKLFEDIQILTRILEAELERGTDTQFITACSEALQERHKLLAELEDGSHGAVAAKHTGAGVRMLRHPAAVEDSAPSAGGVTEHPGARETSY